MKCKTCSILDSDTITMDQMGFFLFLRFQNFDEKFCMKISTIKTKVVVLKETESSNKVKLSLCLIN
jgi:hypothetical protein